MYVGVWVALAAVGRRVVPWRRLTVRAPASFSGPDRGLPRGPGRCRDLSVASDTPPFGIPDGDRPRVRRRRHPEAALPHIGAILADGRPAPRAGLDPGAGKSNGGCFFGGSVRPRAPGPCAGHALLPRAVGSKKSSMFAAMASSRRCRAARLPQATCGVRMRLGMSGARRGDPGAGAPGTARPGPRRRSAVLSGPPRGPARRRGPRGRCYCL